MRACNRCKNDVAGDYLAFEGTFIDWNYDLDLCEFCAMEFKNIVDAYCNTKKIDTSTALSEEERAEREPVSRLAKKLKV